MINYLPDWNERSAEKENNAKAHSLDCLAVAIDEKDKQ